MAAEAGADTVAQAVVVAEDTVVEWQVDVEVVPSAVVGIMKRVEGQQHSKSGSRRQQRRRRITFPARRPSKVLPRFRVLGVSVPFPLRRLLLPRLHRRRLCLQRQLRRLLRRWIQLTLKRVQMWVW